VDTIALFAEPNNEYSIAFQNFGRWYPLLFDGNVRTWKSADQARAFLELTADTYYNWYGDLIGWDIDSIPVLTERN